MIHYQCLPLARRPWGIVMQPKLVQCQWLEPKIEDSLRANSQSWQSTANEKTSDLCNTRGYGGTDGQNRLKTDAVL